jgi:hypothetical protein
MAIPCLMPAKISQVNHNSWEAETSKVNHCSTEEKNKS